MTEQAGDGVTTTRRATASPDRALLGVTDLELAFRGEEGTTQVLHGVSFEVNRGEIVGIVGESGSGKSVTALAMLGLLGPSATVLGGGASFDGIDLLHTTGKAMRAIRGRRIGMVFQDPMTALDPVMRVGDQIDEGYRIHHRSASRKEARRRTLEVLELVGVPDPQRRARQYPHQWSGGMRQRAVIALALVNEPELIIADEPTTALDATVQSQVLDVLADAREATGVSVMLITHDLGVIAEVADRVVVMYAGRVVERSTTRELFDSCRHPYAAALMTSRPGRVARGSALHPIPGRPPSMTELPGGCPFHPRCEHPAKDASCSTLRPALTVTSDGRAAACHHSDHPLDPEELLR